MSNVVNISEEVGLDELYPTIATNGTYDVTFSWYRDNFGSLNVYVGYYNTQTQAKSKEQISTPLAVATISDIVYSDNGDLHLVFMYNADTIYYRFHNNSGWFPGGNPINLSLGLPDTSSVHSPKIAYDKLNDKIYVSWANNFVANLGNPDIVLKNKTVGGSFTNYYKKITNTGDPVGVIGNDLKIDNDGRVYCAFERDTSDLYLHRVNDSKTQLVDTSGDLNALSIGIDHNDSVHLTWQIPEEIYYKTFDRFLPQLNVLNPSNNTIIKGNITIQSTVDYDIDEVRYFYYDDIDADGVTDDGDGGSWHYVGRSNMSTGWDFIWETNKTGNMLNVLKAVLKINATDKNGLDESILLGNLTIDNLKPKTCRIIEIYDDSIIPHNSSIGNRHFNGTVYIKYEAFDNNSRISKVSLYNGSTFIADNLTNNEIVLITGPGTFDGNYSALTIIAYDYAGNINQTAIFPEIEIDNIVPIIEFEFANKSEHTGIFELKIRTHLDINIGNITVWNSTSAVFATSTQLLNPVHNINNGWWNYTIDSTEYNGTMYYKVRVNDEMNYVNISILKLYLDNKDPGTDIINFNENDLIGASDELIIIEVDVDTVNVTLLWRDDVTDSFELVDYNFTFVNISGGRKRTTILFTEGDTVTDTDLFIRAMAIDDIGLLSSDTIELEISPLLPISVSNFEAKRTSKKYYNITLTWREPKFSEFFLIYRSYRSFDEDYLNLLIYPNPDNFYAIMGNTPGQRYCVGKVNNNTSSNFNTFEDKVCGPHIYYYLIVNFNAFFISEVQWLNITIEAEPVERGLQENQTNTWIFFFLIFIGIVFMMTQMQVKRIKFKYHKGRVRMQFTEITSKEIAKFEEEGLDLDARAPSEMIALASATKEKKTGIFEQFIKEEEVSFDEKKEVKIEKCPTCGWILSSTATKCPRCGWRRLD